MTVSACTYLAVNWFKADVKNKSFSCIVSTGNNIFFGLLLSVAVSMLSFAYFLRLATSDNLLITIQEKIKWADTMSELDKKHKKELDEKVEEVKKSLSLKVSKSFHSVFSYAL